jgi:hypothetical protein
MTKRAFVGAVALIVGMAAIAMGPLSSSGSGQARGQAVAVDPDDIGGVVTGPKGPEAGVWVIAETTDLPTKFRKIVVTDDRGRYVLPDLPKATYRIWVRGYGLVDSTAVPSAPGRQLNLTATPAPDARAAAAVYPGNYWYSLIQVPPKSDFPGTGPQGNGIPPAMQSQADWISHMKNGCELCHQVGNKATREFPAALGKFADSKAAWSHRVQVGQDGGTMAGSFGRFGPRGLALFADWTDRIAAGEVPPAPPRPQGLERNLVVTSWDWGSPNSFVHDEISTDKRNPSVNAGGPLYGLDYTNDKLLLVDPIANKASEVPLPVRDPAARPSKPARMPAPSPYWGQEIYWTGRAAPHSAMVDTKGRVWMTTQIGRTQMPEFCKGAKGSEYLGTSQSESGAALRGGSVVLVYDPATKQVTPIDTCFSTHHVQFAEDKDNTVYFSGDANVLGWINTRIWDETHDAAKSQGWCPSVVDTNGDGAIGEYTDPNQPIDPKLDRRIRGSSYGLITNPVDGSVWYATSGPMPGRIVRLEIGNNAPASCKAEVYEPPFHPSTSGASGYSPKGIDIDRTGVIWVGLGGSGHLASFDRRKCKVMNGPTATGQQCEAGWTLHATPGPRFKGVTDDANADHMYYNWVDQFGALGLGPNLPMAIGTGSDSLLALQPNRQWVVLRVPYPLGFYSRSMSGRIDDAKAGWKGRAVYADYGANNVWHTEGGKGTRGAIVRFQMRPEPLAK